MKEQPKAIYGLVGYPVSHSLSPLMHNAAFKALGVNAGYKLFPLKEEEVKNFFLKLHEKESSIFGLNVTIPYKEKVIPYLDSLSPYVQKTMAVNTVVIDSQRNLKGHNTDGPGFLAHITKLGFQTQGKNIALLGCGGAARAIISILCLLPERPASVRIYDIDQKKMAGLLGDLKNRLDVSIVRPVENIRGLDLKNSQLFINATPIGMQESDPCLIEKDLLHKDMLVYDLIYSPFETKLLQLAKNKGAKVSNGLGMLFYQGVLAFQHWADLELEDQIKKKMWDSLIKGIKQHG